MPKRSPTTPAFGMAERGLLILTIVFCILGLVAVFEASGSEALQTFGNQFYFIKQQAVWCVAGIFALVAGAFFPLKWWQKIGPWLYVVGLILMLAVFLPGIGKSVNGAHRWLTFAGITVQPGELIKFGMIAFFSTWLTKHQKVLPFLFMTLLPVGLLLLQPDLGSALIVLAIAFGLYFVAGAPYRIFAILGGVGVIALLVLIVMSPYRLRRVTTFLNPEADPLGASFHIHQITIALGSGGLLGEGIGQSRQKFSYLPEASTDSIFAIVSEEVGFVGASFLLILFFAFLNCAHRIVQKTPTDSFTRLFASGIFIWLSMQFLLNLAAIVALVPLTGIPLPFFSYGGSALVMVLGITGILLGLGRQVAIES